MCNINNITYYILSESTVNSSSWMLKNYIVTIKTSRHTFSKMKEQVKIISLLYIFTQIFKNK